MGDTQKLDTYRKALTLNLDPSTFGSFAEIGAGQEVARWFLVVGGASGTVAKAISAYDKQVSDDLYGSGSPYVSKQRLQGQANAGTTRLLPAVIPDHICAPLKFFGRHRPHTGTDLGRTGPTVPSPAFSADTPIQRYTCCGRTQNK